MTSKKITKVKPKFIFHYNEINPSSNLWLSTLQIGSESMFCRSLKSDPNHVATLCNYGWLQMDGLNNPMAAWVLFERALILEPTHPQTLFNYACLMEKNSMFVLLCILCDQSEYFNDFNFIFELSGMIEQRWCINKLWSIILDWCPAEDNIQVFSVMLRRIQLQLQLFLQEWTRGCYDLKHKTLSGSEWKLQFCNRSASTVWMLNLSNQTESLMSRHL